MAFKSYTSCVQPQDYQDIAPSKLEAALILLATGPTSPLTMLTLQNALEYMLNGKLVCLGGDRCAVGQIVGFETVEDKSFPDSVDNDFSFNLLLAPDSLGDYIGKDLVVAQAEAITGVQGVLLAEQPNMPVPHEPKDGKRHHPYPMEPLSIEAAYALGAWAAPMPPKGPVKVPVLHCECEGSRIHDLLKTLEDISGLGTGICKVKFLGIPIGKLVCSVVATLLWPIIYLALIVAWNAARDGNADDARTPGDLPGELKAGNMVVVTGRWVYDAGHEGWNELHPVTSIQKIGESMGSIAPLGDGKAFVDRWCRLVLQVPPPDRDGPGTKPQTMRPEQQKTWDTQRQPENRWNLHPAIDGCEPADRDEPDDVIR